MDTPRILEAIEHQSVGETAGLQGEERHQALYYRWQQLIGMSQLALQLGLPKELRDALQGHQDWLRDALWASAEAAAAADADPDPAKG